MKLSTQVILICGKLTLKPVIIPVIQFRRLAQPYDLETSEFKVSLEARLRLSYKTNKAIDGSDRHSMHKPEDQSLTFGTSRATETRDSAR